MKKYLVSNSQADRISFVENIKCKGKKIGIFNHISLRGMEKYFDIVVKLSDLYKDANFLNLLPKVDDDTAVFFIDLGLDYCSFKADYIKPYTKLNPISQQANQTYIIDGFAFYNTEKAIYRPFLYIDETILNTSIQEFYNVGIYSDFEGNSIENYYKKIAPFMDVRNSEIAIEVVVYQPTEDELQEYEKLKKEIILEKKFPKIKVINELQKYIYQTASYKNALLKSKKKHTLYVEKNTTIERKKMYQNIIKENSKKVVFYSSNSYGIDSIELSRTKGTLERHNQLIKLLKNGN